MALAQIPIAIGIGALQAAAVLATPLPTYEFGTQDHVGGNAIVGDGNKHELAITPSGKMIKTANVPTIMSLPAHTKVFPDYDKALQEMAFNASIRSMGNSVNGKETYNDALMRKTMGSLMNQSEKQTGELSRLKSVDSHLGNVVSVNMETNRILRSLKKNPWVS